MNGPKELANVLAALPHGKAFCFVSELTSLEPMVQGRGAWVVDGSETFFAGHFPGDPIVPGVLLAEALAQLCGLVAFAGVPESHVAQKPARLAQIDVKVHAAVRPPAAIELSARFVREHGPLLLFEVAARSSNLPAADGRIVLARTL